MGPFNKLVIIDLEATCWERGEHKPSEMETIEIGAVLVDNVRVEAFDELDLFVRPIRHPVLSDFCMELTSIRQKDVDTADLFPVAWQRFMNWVADSTDLCVASWGAYDSKQLKQDCIYHDLVYPFENRHLNLKRMFGAMHGDRKFGMKRALRMLGLKLEGTHHRGIDDARNIFRIYQQMQSLRGHSAEGDEV